MPDRKDNFSKLDSVCREVTGKSVFRVVADFAEIIKRDRIATAAEVKAGDPLAEAYIIIGAEPGWSDAEVKSLYRVLVRAYHNDTATCPNKDKYDKVVKAYKLIMASRKKV